MATQLITGNNPTEMEWVPCEQISNSTSHSFSDSNASRHGFPILYIPKEVRLEIMLHKRGTHTPPGLLKPPLRRSLRSLQNVIYPDLDQRRDLQQTQYLHRPQVHQTHLNISLPVKFHAQKLTLQNNLKSIHIDISLDYSNSDSPDYHDKSFSYGPRASLESIMRELVGASITGIKMVRVTGLHSANDMRLSGFGECLENGKLQLGFTNFTLGVEPIVEIEGGRFTVTWKHEGEGFREMSNITY